VVTAIAGILLTTFFAIPDAFLILLLVGIFLLAMGATGSVIHRFNLAPTTDQTTPKEVVTEFADRVSRPAASLAARKAARAESETPQMRRSRTHVRLTTRSSDIKAVAKGVELTQWVYPRETMEVTCKVQRPDAKIDSASVSPTVGLATTVRKVYPDDFCDSSHATPALARGEYKVVWTESSWVRRNPNPWGITTASLLADERHERTIGSGSFTVTRA